MKEIQLDNFVYSCTQERKRGNEHFVADHALTYILDGAIEFYRDQEVQAFPAGTIGLVRRNQLVKSVKIPSGDRPFQSINIFLGQDILHRYCAENNPGVTQQYQGETLVLLSGDPFIKGFFDSLLPYLEQPAQLTPDLAELKTREAIALLVRNHPGMKNFLFDFSEPHKIDLEAFMNQHFIYNVPLRQFARLTGRSLATFKRDFQKIFNLSPERWLLRKRLEQAHFLIGERNQRPAAVYLEVGFENMSHFSFAFKKWFGYNPSSLHT